MKKMLKRAKQSARDKAIHLAKKQHVGKRLAKLSAGVTKMAIRQAAQQAVGSGAYGRGAYGRGHYQQDGGDLSKAAVNSLFVDYPHRRHSTTEIGDETGRVRVSRREYVMRVVAPAAGTEFENTSFAINPGLSGVFAWLSQIAANYDEYELEHLVFSYKPVISQASTSGAMGSILFSANYNAGSPKFASFREMAEYIGTLETRICDPAMFGVECDPTKHGSQAVEYIRTGSVPVGQDIKTYDLGTFQIATSDISDAFEPGDLLGHLYVDYEVILGKPKLFTALGKGIRQDYFRGVAGITAGLPFGSAPFACTANSMGLTLNGASVEFPDNFYGTVLVNYFMNGEDIDITNLALTGNVTSNDCLGQNGDGGSEKSITVAGTGAQNIQRLLVVKPATGGVINKFRVNVASITSASGFSLDVQMSNPDIGDSWVSV